MMKVLITLLLFAFHCLAQAESDLNVELRLLCPAALAEEAQQQLSAAALGLLKTSNFNSASHRKIMQTETPDIQKRYRRVASEKLLIVSFTKPREVQTLGGKIQVQEIVIGLTAPALGPVFTVDPESRVVEHAKYDGTHLEKLLELAQQLTSLK